MSEQNVTLTIAFLEKHPKSAARILEQHDSRTVANFISNIPLSCVEKVVACIMPDFIAHICKYMDVGEVTKILSSLETSQIATVLRYLDTKKRNDILEDFPMKTRVACNLLLRFSQKTVGAWMTPHVPTISDDSTIKDALHILRNVEKIVQVDAVFVVSRERLLKGRIHYIDLIQSDPEQPLHPMVEDGGKLLSGHISLKQALTYSGWKKTDILPVVNRKNQFIGALRHVDLRRGLHHLESQIDQPKMQNQRSGMATLYSEAMLAIFQTMSNMVVESDMAGDRS